VLLSLLWGGSFFFIAIAVTELPPLVIVAARVLIAALALHVVLLIGGERLPTTAAAIGGLRADGGVEQRHPVQPARLGPEPHRERARGNPQRHHAVVHRARRAFRHHRRAADGRAGSPACWWDSPGVVAMIGPGALAGVEAEVLAELACLGAALCYGLATVFGRRFRRLGLSPVQTATGQLTASTLIMVPLALVFAAPWTLPVPSPAAIGSVVALALASTAFAYIVFFRILARSGATSISLVTFMVPVSAMLLGTLVLGERLAAEHFLGIALIGAGLALIDGRPLKRIAAALGRRA
jgi:drug/metabolite transporter (DMT)-like permease